MVTQLLHTHEHNGWLESHLEAFLTSAGLREDLTELLIHFLFDLASLFVIFMAIYMVVSFLQTFVGVQRQIQRLSRLPLGVGYPQQPCWECCAHVFLYHRTGLYGSGLGWRSVGALLYSAGLHLADQFYYAWCPFFLCWAFPSAWPIFSLDWRWHLSPALSSEEQLDRQRKNARRDWPAALHLHPPLSP